MGAGRAACLLCLARVLLCACAAHAQQCNQKDAFVVKNDMTADVLGQEADKQSSAGYRMTSLTAYALADGVRHGATWIQPTSAAAPQQQILANLTLADLQQQLNDTKDLCIKSITGYTLAGTDYYAALWDAPQGSSGCPEADVRPAMTHDEYAQQFQAWSGTHYPLWVQQYANGAKVSGIFIKNGAGSDPGRGGWVTEDSLDLATFNANNAKYANQGYRLMVLTGFSGDGADGYAAVWWKGGNNRQWTVRVGLSADAYECQGSNLAYSGYVPLFINTISSGSVPTYQAIYELQGMRPADLSAVDKVVADYNRSTPLPSLSIALAKGGRLRFARTWGYTDNSKQSACPTSKYRLASVSKPITATGIFKLIEQGLLALTDKVFGQGAVLGTMYGSQPYPRYVTDVTVQHLLEHTAGIEWSNVVADPVFDEQHINDNQAQLIGWVLNSVRLSRPPGSSYNYSNIGYMILARIIERIAGQAYEDWVRAEVLAPLGADGLFLAGSTLADRRPNEVMYFFPEAPNLPYELNVGRMDGHGGWAGSSLDLIRFALGVDGKSTINGQAVPEALGPQAYASMLTPGARNNAMARGWAVRGMDHWGAGAIPGTNAEVGVLQNNDVAHTIMTNTRTPDENVLALIHDIRDAIQVWPCDGFDA